MRSCCPAPGERNSASERLNSFTEPWGCQLQRQNSNSSLHPPYQYIFHHITVSARGQNSVEVHYIRSAAAAAKLLQLCLTLCDPIDCSPPGSPIPGILQARTLEWVYEGINAQSCPTLCDSVDYSPSGSSVTGVVCHFLLQGIFLTQGLNPGLLRLLHW